MNILTIILFFVYTWGFGFTASYFLKEPDNVLERNLIRIGMGLGVFIVVGTLLNLFGIPLDWKLFLMLSVVFPLCILVKKAKSKELKMPEFKFKLTKSNLNILMVLVIFFISLQMYAGGSFSYPYLEDDDPWNHAAGVKYIAVEKTAYDSANFPLHYLDPYPPGYEMLLGVLHQTSSSLSWTLKFFNGLILSFGILFFYFFCQNIYRR